MRIATLWPVLVIALLAGPARAADCPATGADATVEAIKAAATCAAAADVYVACTWGSSMDVQFAEVAIGKCEADFLGKLSPKQKMSYERERKQCNDKYAKKSGTLYLSLAASCHVNVVKSYSTRFAKAKAK